MVINDHLGLIALIGSGETTRFGGQVFERLIRQYPVGSRIAVLETPAGFELNSPAVAGRVAEYMRSRLKNYEPDIHLIPARKQGTEQSPDSLSVIRSMADAALMFMGAGSPSYTVRQLQESLAWELVWAKYLQGTSLAFASAAAIAVGKFVLPVYEIYKVGADLHWLGGLDLLSAFGLATVVIPHWNNHDGGDGLDTSHSFIGLSRFEQMLELLPEGVTIIGIDELTTLVIDLAGERCDVMGVNQVHLIRNGNEMTYNTRSSFGVSELGEFHPHKMNEIRSVDIQNIMEKHLPVNRQNAIPPHVTVLVEERQQARERKDWLAADHLRQQIESLGWQITDTPEGPELSFSRS